MMANEQEPEPGPAAVEIEVRVLGQDTATHRGVHVVTISVRETRTIIVLDHSDGLAQSLPEDLRRASAAMRVQRASLIDG